MGIDWKDLAQTVIGIGAPTLGLALGGPLGATAGTILANVLGAAPATPAAVQAAITERSTDAAAMAEAARQAESEWLEALAEIGKVQVAEVGATQRAEIASDDSLQRWWRPIYALELSLLECPAFALVLLHSLWIGHQAAIDGLVNLTSLLVAYFGARFGILGVYVSGRTREKQACVTGQVSPTVIGELLKLLKKK